MSSAIGPVDESGQNAAHDAAEPAHPEAAAESAAPEIKVEPIAQARHRKLDDDKAPVLYVPAARERFSRAAVLAVAIALSAAVGSAVGAVAAVAFATPQPLSTDDGRTVEVNALRGVITQLSSEVASLKASVETSAKTANAQMARIADRVDRAEKAQAEPASRVLKLSEMLERIERRTASAAPAASPETTGSIAVKQDDRPAVVNGWVLREAFRGGAIVENDRMGIFEVVPGANLPGLGRVETIRRQDGRWVVVTPKGFIVSQR
jgi:gas vesicle protein